MESIKEFKEIIERYPLFREDELHIVVEHTRNVREMVVQVYGIEDGKLLTSDKVYLKHRKPGEDAIAFWERFKNELPPDKQAIFLKGDKSKKILVKHNLRLVVNLSKNHQYQEDFNHILQEAVHGLIKGIEKFDPERGYKLSTYVYWWVRQSVTRYCGRNRKNSPISLSADAGEKRRQLDKAKQELFEQKGASYSRQDLAEKLGWSLKTVGKYLDNHAIRPVFSLDAIVCQGGEEINPLGNLISSEPEENMHLMGMRDVIARLSEKAGLKPQEKEVLRLIYWGGMSRQEVGDSLGISRGQVKSVQDRSLRRLKIARKQANLKIDSMKEVLAYK